MKIIKIDAAITKEQGVTFTVVSVKNGTINSQKREDIRNSFANSFPEPIILMEQNSRGVPTYHGRTDIVNFLSKINFSFLPWKSYTFN